MKKLLFIPFTLFLVSSFAQTFEKVYGSFSGRTGTWFIPTNDSGFYVTSYNELIKTNRFGDSLHAVIVPFNYSSGEGGYCTNCKDKIVLTFNYDSVVTINQFIDTIFIVVADTNGNVTSLWEYGDTLGLVSSYIIRTSDNGYLFGAGIWNTDYVSHIFLMKLDSNGNIQWKKIVLPYYNWAEELVTDLIETPDHYYIAEIYQSSGGNDAGQKIMLKIDTLGNILWSTQLTHGYRTSIRNQTVATDSGYIYVDNTNYIFTSFGFSRISFVDTGGILQWSKVFYNSGISYSGITLNNQGGFYLYGTISAGNGNIIVTELDQHADSMRSFIFGYSTSYEYPRFFEQLDDNRLAFIGSTKTSGSSTSDIYFVVIDTSGNFSAGYENVLPRKSEVMIFPNPTNNTFTIKYISTKEKTEVEIMNVLGENVYTVKLFGKNEYVVDANLAKGIYFVRVYDEEKYVVQKLIVE